MSDKEKAFRAVFEAQLKEYGFRRKGKVFYRFRGNIIEAVSTKGTISGGTIFAYYPYWLHYIKNGDYNANLKRNYWVEESEIMYEPFQIGNRTYEWQEEKFKVHFEEFNSKVMPILDKVCDLESFIESRIFVRENRDSLRKSEDGVWLGINDLINQHVLLLKAYNDGSYDNVRRIFNEMLEYRVRAARESHEHSVKQRKILLNDPDIDKDFFYYIQDPIPEFSEEKYRENVIQRHYAKLKDHIDNDKDPSWVYDLSVKEGERFRQDFKEIFKYDI